MPFMMIMLAMLATLFLGADGRQERRADEAKAAAQATATQMAWYHSQAVRQCSAPGSCPTGEITVNQAGLNGTLNLATRFQSATNGSLVVTTWRGSPAGTDARTMRGMVGTALGNVTDSSLHAGVYDAAAARIRSSVAISYVDGSTTHVGRSTLTVPPTVGSVTLLNGVPAMATQIN